MRKFTILTLLLLNSLVAEVKDIYLNKSFLKEAKEKNIKIFDIRTEGEWRESGVIENSIPLTFFREDGGYNIDNFLSTLNSHIKKEEQFAIVCRTGSRTKVLSRFLDKLGYNVINLQGGILYLKGSGYKLKKF